MKRDDTRRLKPHVSIEPDGAGVGSADVEERSNSFKTMFADNFPDEPRGVPPLAERWMGADGADLGEPLKFQAFAAHREKLPRVRTNAKVRTHLTGPAAEESGKGQRGEYDHFIGVRPRKWNDGD